MISYSQSFSILCMKGHRCKVDIKGNCFFLHQLCWRKGINESSLSLLLRALFGTQAVRKRVGENNVHLKRLAQQIHRFKKITWVLTIQFPTSSLLPPHVQRLQLTLSSWEDRKLSKSDLGLSKIPYEHLCFPCSIKWILSQRGTAR